MTNPRKDQHNTEQPHPAESPRVAGPQRKDKSSQRTGKERGRVFSNERLGYPLEESEDPDRRDSATGERGGTPEGSDPRE